MPHVIVKMYPGRTEDQKRRLADAITQAVVSIAVCSEDAVSVSIEEVTQDRWKEEVYEPFISKSESTMYRKIPT